jgi:hypothetical protein
VATDVTSEDVNTDAVDVDVDAADPVVDVDAEDVDVDVDVDVDEVGGGPLADVADLVVDDEEDEAVDVEVSNCKMKAEHSKPWIPLDEVVGKSEALVTPDTMGLPRSFGGTASGFSTLVAMVTPFPPIHPEYSIVISCP